MLIASALAFFLFGLSGLIHYFAMSRSHERLVRSNLPRGARLIVSLYVSGAAHVAEAVVYAFGFEIGQALGVGGFSKDDQMSMMDTVYFSLVNYTSLGLGDIYPTGHLRMIAGVESLNGFLLISCSASFIYLVMSKGLEQEKSCCDAEFEGNGGSAGSYRLTLGPPPPPIGSVATRVVDALSGEAVRGDAPPFARVRLVECDERDCNRVVAVLNPNSQGRVLFLTDFTGEPLPAGRYQVIAFTEDGGYGEIPSEIFEVAVDEELDVGDVDVQPPLINFTLAADCAALLPQGGNCPYTVRIANNTDQPLGGATWSIVEAYGLGSTLDFTRFEAASDGAASAENGAEDGSVERHRRITLGARESADFGFLFTVPGFVRDGAMFCAELFVGLDPSPLVNTTRSGQLFCLEKGVVDYRMLDSDALDDPRDALAVEVIGIRAENPSAAVHGPEHRARADIGRGEPAIERGDRAPGRVGLGRHRDRLPVPLLVSLGVGDLDDEPLGVTAQPLDVHPRELGATQGAGEPEQDQRPIAQRRRALVVEPVGHALDLVIDGRLALRRRLSFRPAADPAQRLGHHDRIGRGGQPGAEMHQADRRDPAGDGARGAPARGLGGEEQRERLRGARQRLAPDGAGPGLEQSPVAGVGAPGGLRSGEALVAGCFCIKVRNATRPSRHAAA